MSSATPSPLDQLAGIVYRAWVVVDGEGTPERGGIGTGRRDAILNWFGLSRREKRLPPMWRYWRRQGYRCIPAFVEPLYGKVRHD